VIKNQDVLVYVHMGIKVSFVRFKLFVTKGGMIIHAKMAELQLDLYCLKIVVVNVPMDI